MEKLSLKVKLYEAVRRSLTETAEEALRVMNEAQASAREYGAPRDRYDAYRNQMMARSEMFARQLEEARDEMTTLESMDLQSIRDTVAFGTVVITSTRRLFISVSAGKIAVDGETYHAISVKVPVFLVMQGLRKGDEYEFRGKRQKIVDVF